MAVAVAATAPNDTLPLPYAHAWSGDGGREHGILLWGAGEA